MRETGHVVILMSGRVHGRSFGHEGLGVILSGKSTRPMIMGEAVVFGDELVIYKWAAP